MIRKGFQLVKNISFEMSQSYKLRLDGKQNGEKKREIISRF